MPSTKEPQCSYEYRNVLLHPSIKVGGGASLYRCDNRCVPYLVFCAQHADKKALVLLVQHLDRKLKRASCQHENLSALPKKGE